MKGGCIRRLVIYLHEIYVVGLLEIMDSLLNRPGSDVLLLLSELQVTSLF